MTPGELLKLRRRAVARACALARPAVVRRGLTLVLAFNPRISNELGGEDRRTADTTARTCSSSAEAREVEARFELLLVTTDPRPVVLLERDELGRRRGFALPSSPELLDLAIELQRAAMRQATRRARGGRRRRW